MTTSRIYAYRWPARLVSHKPFAAERYFITSACNWQVFFQKNTNFLFYFLRTMFGHIFCAECTISAALFQWKTPPRFRMALPGLFYTVLYKKSRPPLRAAGNSLSNHFFCFSRSAKSSRGVTYTVVYTSYSTMPGLAPLAFQMFFTSVVSTATFAPVPALNALE